MFKLVIQDDEGKTTIVPLVRDEITIGRKEGNTIRLTERNVSRRHARILRNNGEVHIEDLGSYNGIRVNNARIAERVSLRVSDQVQIGDYKLYLKAEGAEQTDEGLTTPLQRVESQVPVEAMSSVVGGAPHAIPSTPPPMMAQNRLAVADTDPTGRSIGPATAAAVAAMSAPGGYGRLVVLSSNFAGKEFELSRPQMIVGRTDENDVVINHRSISRNHAKIVREPETGRYTISDLQSSNGVRVNGQDYGKVELRRGDVIDLGHVRLRFIEAGEDFLFARDAVITDVPEAGSRRGLMVALLAALIVLGAGIAIYLTRDDKPNDSISPSTPTTGSGTSAGSETEAIVVAPPEADPPPQPGPEPDKVPVAATPATPPRADDVKAQVAKCTELATQNAWQSLDDCATVLGTLGAKDKATEFHDKARRETENDRASAEVGRLLREGNLKGAQAAKKQIGADSVYYKAVHDSFMKAENQAIDAAKRTALNYATSRDCATLRRYIVQLREGSTERVAAAAQAQRCQLAPEPPPPRPDQQPPPQPTVARETPQPKGQCDPASVDELMAQAASQFSAGYSKVALAQVVKALACKQEAKMYRFAVTYACAARDLATAKLYFAKVPREFQPALEQRCQQENLDIRGGP
jgi:ABC transport system ATP-binding/permease protein